MLGTTPPISLCFHKMTRLRNTTSPCYSLHAASDSSDPSGHSSSPSHFHLAGMQWPLSQVKSDSAQVFFAARKKKEKKGTWHEHKRCRRRSLHPVPLRMTLTAPYWEDSFHTQHCFFMTESNGFQRWVFLLARTLLPPLFNMDSLFYAFFQTFKKQGCSFSK